MRNSISYEIFKEVKKQCPKTLSYDPFNNIQDNLVKIPNFTKIDGFLFLSNGDKFKRIYSFSKTKKKIIDSFKYYLNN